MAIHYSATNWPEDHTKAFVFIESFPDEQGRHQLDVLWWNQFDKKRTKSLAATLAEVRLMGA